MERDIPHSLTYAELEEKSRTRRAHYAREDQRFEAECAREIDSLEAGVTRKLKNFDEESQSTKDDVKNAAQGAIASLKARHETELRIVKKRHAEELAKIEKDGQNNLMKASNTARDQRSDLEHAYQEAITKKRQEHAKLREQVDLGRKSEEEAEMAQLYNVFQRTVTGQPSEFSRSPVVAEERTLLPRPPSPHYSPHYYPILNDDSDVDVVELSPRAGKRKKGSDENEANADSSSVLMLTDDELHNDPTTQGPKSSSSWEFATRYKKNKDKLATAVPPATSSDSIPSTEHPNLPARPAHLPTKPAFSQYMPQVDTQSRQGLHRGSHQEVFQEYVSGYASGYAQTSAALPSRHSANMSSPFSKAPANAPKGPRGTPRGIRREQSMPVVIVAQSVPHMNDRCHEKKRARREDRNFSNSNHIPLPGGESYSPLQESTSLQRGPEGHAKATQSDVSRRERREHPQKPSMPAASSTIQSSEPQFSNPPLCNLDRDSSTSIPASRYYSELDHATELKDRHSTGSERSGQGGNLPVCPAQSVSSALERTFIDPSSDPPSRKSNAIVIDAYSIKKIQYTRNDETLFEWTQSVPGKAELRLDNFIYKPYIKNKVWKVCEDWHYSNWAIVPNHVELLRYNKELAILYVKRVKTSQASAELWIKFENEKILMDFLTSFKRRPGCAKKDAEQLDDSVVIPEAFSKG